MYSLIQYDTIEAVKEDIEDESNSCILEHLQSLHIDHSFFIAFCCRVNQIECAPSSHPDATPNDEWGDVLLRMMQDTSFPKHVYTKTVEYFRDDQVR